MSRSRVFSAFIVLAALVLAATPATAQCDDPCLGQGNATLLMRAKCDIGTVAKFRMGGAPSGFYELLMDFGVGPVEVPGVGTFCLDMGPDMMVVASGNLSVRGYASTYMALPDDPMLLGQVLAFQLRVEDMTAPNDVAISNGFSLTLCPEGTEGDECIPCPGEGCTPGYWKNHHQSWPPSGFAPGDALSAAFAIPECLEGCTDPDFKTATLDDALNFQGGDDFCGKAEILFRAAVASLLNSAHPSVDFPMTLEEVVLMVDSALASCDEDVYTGVGGELDYLNNLGCPLGNFEGIAGEEGNGDEEPGCDRGITMLDYIQAIRYEDGFPVDVMVRVVDTDNPGDVLGELAFSFDPDSPPMFPLTNGALCVKDINVHVGSAVLLGNVDVTLIGKDRFPDMTTFEVTIGNVVSSRDIATSCDEPIGTGSKFNPVFIDEVVVFGPVGFLKR